MKPLYILVQEKMNLPDWIRETPSFTKEISDLFIQSRVVFYPRAGADGHPIKLFGASRAALYPPVTLPASPASAAGP